LAASTDRFDRSNLREGRHLPAWLSGRKVPGFFLPVREMWLVKRDSSHVQGLKGLAQGPDSRKERFLQASDRLGFDRRPGDIDMNRKGKTDSKKSIIASLRQSLSRMPSARVDLTSAEERARINALMN